MTTKRRSTREKVENPSIEVRISALSAHIKICPDGWFPEFFGVCIFTSKTTGTVYQIQSPLKGSSATEIVNWLFLHHKQNGFVLNTPAERKRLLSLVVGRLEAQAKIYQATLKKYGYPLRFKAR